GRSGKRMNAPKERKRKRPASKEWRRLSGFEPVAIAFAFLVSVGLIVFAVTSADPLIQESLSLAPDKPWGVLTSAFVHGDAGHLLNNIQGFALSCVFFLLANFGLNLKERRHISRLFAWLIFISAFASDAVELVIWQLSATTGVSSFGSSGIVYASLGVVLSSAIFSSGMNLEKLRMAKRRKKSPLKAKDMVIPALSVIIFLIIFLELVLTPEFFFSVGPGVDVFAHEFGFFLGFASSFLMFVRWMSKSPSRRKSSRSP
ncbi:MAG: rhomboid family intramembrane serine protease, partial [Candidatus Hadarchaeota archaeon]